MKFVICLCDTWNSNVFDGLFITRRFCASRWTNYGTRVIVTVSSSWAYDLGCGEKILESRENDGSGSLRFHLIVALAVIECRLRGFLIRISFFSFQYIVLLILVFLLELSAGTLAYIYERNVEEELNMTLNDTFIQNYAVSERHSKAIDLMQQNFVCCGAIRFEEYRQSVWLKSKRKDLIRSIEDRVVPDSCCISMAVGCGRSEHPSNIPYTVRTGELSNRLIFIYISSLTGLHL